MSVRVLSKAFRHSTAELADRLTLLVLADQAADDGVCWPGQDVIAGLARISERQVRRSLKALEEAGEVEARKAQRGRRRINVYRVRMPGLPEVDYDRLPFVVSEDFTTGQIVRSPIGDDRTSTPATTGALRARGGADPLVGPARTSEAIASSDGASVPERWKDEAGHLPDFDQLSVSCTADPDARGSEIAAALKKIRSLVWRDLDEEHRAAFREPAAFAGLVAELIATRAGLYRTRLPGATLTPTALAKWWADLPKLGPGTDKLSASEIAAMYEGKT